jgi:ribose transport system ATP-binding protein
MGASTGTVAPAAPAEGGSGESPLLEVRHLSKSFGGTQALSDVSFSMRRGEVVALVGENGAGKSTLIKILSGVHEADAGEVRFAGEPLDPSTHPPIAFLHQDLGLIEPMTVGENIALGLGYRRRGALIDWRRTGGAAQRCFDLLGVELSVDQPVVELPRAERSLIALARSLALEPELLVLDEPTASLAKSEVERLFESLRRLAEHGVGQIFVSHRLDEVFEIADRAVVLRDGRLVGDVAIAETTPDQLVEMIVGRAPSSMFARSRRRAGDCVLALDGVSIGDVGPVTLEVAGGELVALVGLRGAGQEAIGQVLSGRARPSGGEVRLDGRPFRPRSPADALAAGVPTITGNREQEGLAPTLTVRENLLLNPAARGRRLWSWVAHRREREQARAMVEAYDVRPRATELPITSLSGGNQQKVILARSLDLARRVAVLEDPTLGVDVGAKAAIYALVDQVLEQGAAVVLISSDFEEVARVAHRAFVLNRGQVVGVLEGAEISVENIVRLAEASA